MNLSNLVNSKNYGPIPFIASFHKMKPEFSYVKNFCTLLIGICSISPIIVKVIIIVLCTMIALFLIFVFILIFISIKYQNKDVSEIKNETTIYIKDREVVGSHNNGSEELKIDEKWLDYVQSDLFFFIVIFRKSIDRGLFTFFMIKKRIPFINTKFSNLLLFNNDFMDCCFPNRSINKCLNDAEHVKLCQSKLRKKLSHLIIFGLSIFGSFFSFALSIFVVMSGVKINSIVNVYDFAQYFSGGIFNYQTSFVRDLSLNLMSSNIGIVSILQDILNIFILLEATIITLILFKKLPDPVVLLLVINGTYLTLLKLYAIYYEISNLLKHQYEIGYDYSKGVKTPSDITVENIPFFISNYGHYRSSKRNTTKADDTSLDFSLKLTKRSRALIVFGTRILIYVSIFLIEKDIDFLLLLVSKDLLLIHVLIITMILTPWTDLGPILYFLNFANIFREIFIDTNERRTSFDKLNKLSIDINKYYAFSVPKNMVNTIVDDMIIGSFTKDINNNKEAAMKKIDLLRDQKLKKYITSAFEGFDKLLLKDIHMSFGRDMIEFIYEGYMYELRFDKLIMGQLDGESGSGKSTISKVLTGYIDYDFALAEGTSNTDGNVKSPICKMTPRSKSLIPLFSTSYSNFVVDYTMDFILGIAKYDYWEVWSNLTSLFNVGDYQSSVETPIKFIRMSTGQKTRLEGSELMMRILDLMETGKSFIGIFDELLGNIDEKNRINMLNTMKDLDKYVDKEVQADYLTEGEKLQKSFIILMIDHSDLGRRMLVYDFLMNIEDKTLKLSIKDPATSKYIRIDDVFKLHKGNSATVGNFEITRHKLDSDTTHHRINKDNINVDTFAAAA